MAVSVMTITGIPSTIRILNELPKRQQKKIIPKAARAGGNPFLKAARANAPGTNKIFKRSLILLVRRYATGAFAIIGQDKGKVTSGAKAARKRTIRGGISGRGDVVPIHLVENPTRAHLVQPKNKRTLAFGFDADTGTSIFARSIRHPGTRGSRFVRKSAQQAQSQAIREFENKLRVETLAEAGRLGSG